MTQSQIVLEKYHNLEIEPIFFQSEYLFWKISHTKKGDLNVRLITEDGEPFAQLSVNNFNPGLGKNQFLLRRSMENDSLIFFLKQNNFIRPAETSHIVNESKFEIWEIAFLSNYDE
ncbi:MAG: hypothetical protein K9W44_09910 [Candidatus Lokiarchaeota archaeon]|nr:hypothetical protein [Candidatus Harpocratesius repetitus]